MVMMIYEEEEGEHPQEVYIYSSTCLLPTVQKRTKSNVWRGERSREKAEFSDQVRSNIHAHLLLYWTQIRKRSFKISIGTPVLWRVWGLSLFTRQRSMSSSSSCISHWDRHVLFIDRFVWVCIQWLLLVWIVLSLTNLKWDIDISLNYYIVQREH